MRDRLPEFRSHGFDQKFEKLDNLILSHPPKKYVRYHRLLTSIFGASLAAVKVLDLGCGRGEFVAFLRTKGVRAFGVELDSRFVKSGEILGERFSDEYPILSLSDAAGQTIFPDGYFDMIVSDQVLEHVAELDTVAKQIARLLRPGGMTVHKFPAKFKVMEPHYHLPLVHWLPKSKVRRSLIKIFLMSGMSKKFFPSYSLDDRADIIFKYSIEETFYRSDCDLFGEFGQNGIEIEAGTGLHHYVKSNRIARRLSKTLPFLPLGRMVGLFKTNVIIGTKTSRL